MAITLPAGAASALGQGDGRGASETPPQRSLLSECSNSAPLEQDGAEGTGALAGTAGLLRRNRSVGPDAEEEVLTRGVLREEFEHFRSSFFREVLAELHQRRPLGLVRDLWEETSSGEEGDAPGPRDKRAPHPELEQPPEEQHRHRTYRTGRQTRDDRAPPLVGALDEDNDIDNATSSTSTQPLSFAWRASHSAPQRATVVDAQGLRRGWPGHERILSIVQQPTFDYAVGLLIMLNAVSIGVQVDLNARNLTAASPPFFVITEWVFCALFVIELSARLYAFRSSFFCGAAWKWNAFDALVVLLQFAEQSLTVALAGQQGVEYLDLNTMRLMRILRLVRIVRLVRVMRLIGELRTIVISISGSMRSLAWTVILLLMLIYSIAVYLTQAVTDARITAGESLGAHREALEHYYGSLAASILALFQSITGGVTWEFALTPLIDCVSPAVGVFFALYIAFALLAIMNVVTGVFVESALQTARADSDTILVGHVREIFSVRGHDVMEWEDFESMIQTEQMQQVCRSIDIDARAARALFQLMDVDESGSVSFDEFLSGCLRLRGGAKASDLMTVLYEGRRQQRYMNHQITQLRRTLAALGSTVAGGGRPSHCNGTAFV